MSKLPVTLNARGAAMCVCGAILDRRWGILLHTPDGRMRHRSYGTGMGDYLSDVARTAQQRAAEAAAPMLMLDGREIARATSKVDLRFGRGPR